MPIIGQNLLSNLLTTGRTEGGHTIFWTMSTWHNVGVRWNETCQTYSHGPECPAIFINTNLTKRKQASHVFWQQHYYWRNVYWVYGRQTLFALIAKDQWIILELWLYQSPFKRESWRCPNTVMSDIHVHVKYTLVALSEFPVQ